MRLLLDTPVWLWSLVEPERLGADVRKVLEGEETELWLSPVSVLQLLAWIESGRVVADGEAEAWVGEALQAVPMREAALSHEVARRAERWRGSLDAVGRVLAATAQVHDLTLVTSDARLYDLEGVRVLANR